MQCLLCEKGQFSQISLHLDVVSVIYWVLFIYSFAFKIHESSLTDLLSADLHFPQRYWIKIIRKILNAHDVCSLFAMLSSLTTV